MKALFPTLLAVCSSCIGDYFSKRYADAPCWQFLCAVATAYVFGTVFWLSMIRQLGNLAQAGKIWMLGATVAMLLISQFVFHESLSGKQWVGIALGFISLVLML